MNSPSPLRRIVRWSPVIVIVAFFFLWWSRGHQVDVGGATVEALVPAEDPSLDGSLVEPTSSRPAGPDEIGGRESVAGELAGSISISVRRDDGRPIPNAKVVFYRNGLEDVICDDQGQATVPVDPGTHELWLPEDSWELEAVARPEPEWRSGAEVQVAAGEHVELELLLYRTAKLRCAVQNAINTNRRPDQFTLYIFDEDRWTHLSSGWTGTNGTVEFEGLTAGTYCIAPPRNSMRWFEPQTVELVMGESRTLYFTTAEPREITIKVATRSGPGKPLLPILWTAQMESLREWTVPPPKWFTPAQGKTKSPTEILIRPLPGPARLTFWSAVQVDNCTQIMAASSWPFDLEVPLEEPIDWPTFEVHLDDFGQLATVNGRVERNFRRSKIRHLVRYTGPDGEPRKRSLRLASADGAFRMVVDLGLVEDNTLQLFEVLGSLEILVETRTLKPGEQHWEIVMGPE